MGNTLTGQNSLTVPRHVVEVKKVAGAAVPIPLHKTAERIALAWDRIRSMLTVMWMLAVQVKRELKCPRSVLFIKILSFCSNDAAYISVSISRSP